MTKTNSEVSGNQKGIKEKPEIDVPYGWLTDTFRIEESVWSVVYPSEDGAKKLYIDNEKVGEGVDDTFSFERDGEPVQVVRHLRNGFYELEVIRNGESLFSGKPTSSEIKGKKMKIMIAVYMLISFWMYLNFRDTIGF